MKQHKAVVTLVEGAIMVAVAVALNFIRINIFPNGGSVELLIIPLAVYAMRRGAGWGVLAGLVFGTIKCFMGGGFEYGVAAFILDYFLAFAAVGLAGFFPDKPIGAVCAATIGRFIFHMISGVTIWAQWMPEEFLGLSMKNVWIYSALYNGSYLLVNAVIAIVIMLILHKTTDLLKRQ